MQVSKVSPLVLFCPDETILFPASYFYKPFDFQRLYYNLHDPGRQYS